MFLVINFLIILFLFFYQIINDMLNNNLIEEDFNYLINQFQISYDDYKQNIKRKFKFFIL
jgi:hypothetical protein